MVEGTDLLRPHKGKQQYNIEPTPGHRFRSTSLRDDRNKIIKYKGMEDSIEPPTIRHLEPIRQEIYVCNHQQFTQKTKS